VITPNEVSNGKHFRKLQIGSFNMRKNKKRTARKWEIIELRKD